MKGDNSKFNGLTRVNQVYPKRKEDSGLEIYTKALLYLPKQSWRMLQNPHSLTSLVFKHKYFRSDDQMNAKTGYNPSLVWKSLLIGRNLLSHGLI